MYNLCRNSPQKTYQFWAEILHIDRRSRYKNTNSTISIPKNIESILRLHMCDRVDQLPFFPYNRGWETQPNNRVLYTNYKDSVIKGGMTIPNIATFDHGTYNIYIYIYIFTYVPRAYFHDTCRVFNGTGRHGFV